MTDDLDSNTFPVEPSCQTLPKIVDCREILANSALTRHYWWDKAEGAVLLD